MPRKKLIVAYCRVSTFEQKRHGHGIEIQVRDVTLFAERQQLFVERFYKDEGLSGVTEDRAGLQHLLHDCQAGRVAKLILPALDRLSRDVRLAENLFYELDKASVEVLIADMPTYDGKNRKDVLVRQIREAIADDNRKDIIERLWKGRQARVRKGKPAGGNVAYGYVRTGKTLVVRKSSRFPVWPVSRPPRHCRGTTTRRCNDGRLDPADPFHDSAMCPR